VPDQRLILSDAVALLRRTPAALASLLRGLPESWTGSTEGEGTWTAYDVVGHLLHAERADWIPRIRHILTEGDSTPLPAFDRTAMFRESAGKSLDDLLNEFAAARGESLTALDELYLSPSDFSRGGLHPKLGPVTLGNLLATWPAHDLTHLHQISRVMARQLSEHVGPWESFLGVLQCDGHSR
jgi:DinB superfamily